MLSQHVYKLAYAKQTQEPGWGLLELGGTTRWESYDDISIAYAFAESFEVHILQKILGVIERIQSVSPFNYTRNNIL